MRRDAAFSRRLRESRGGDREAKRRRRWPLVAVLALCAALAVRYMLGNPASSSRFAPRGPDAVVYPPGDPPVDAAAVLNLSADVPMSVEQLRAEAELVVTRLVASLPDQPEAYAQQALVRSDMGADSDALESWRQALQRDARFAPAYLGIGLIQARRAEFAEAETMLRKAVELDPAAHQPYRELADVLLKTGQSRAALTVAGQYVQRFPDAANSHYWLGQAQLQEGDYAAARRSHEEAVRLDPNWSQPVSSLAQACARLGERDEALRYRQRFAELKKSDEAADRARTRSYDDLDRQRDMAVKVHNVAAQLHLQAGHAQQAEAHWLRAAAIVPGLTRPRETLAALYHQQNRFAAAAEMLRQLAELDPEGGRHETEAARCLIQIGQWDEARRMLQQVLQHAPEAAPAHLLLASTLLREGQSLSAAEQHARRAWELSGSAQALLVLAAVLQEAGDLPQAREVLRQAVDADPSDEQLRRAYEQLLPEN